MRRVMSTTKLPVFKAYDLRGLMPAELNPSLAFSIGRALAQTQPQAKTAILGMDSRATSSDLLRAVAAGLAAEGVTCQSLGLCGTEEVYHAAGAGFADIGIMVTASHNPIEYNGMKLVKRDGQPFDPATDLAALEVKTIELMGQPVPASFADVPQTSHRDAYVAHLLKFVDITAIPAQTIVINAGNGAAGPTADAILAHLPQLKVVRVHHTPDGTFPNGIPNPLLPANRASTADAVVAHGASIGIAWDGDFDRCFFYDSTGRFISSYYIAGLLAESMLAKNPGATIVYDPRLYWDTLATIAQLGGNALVAKVGHGFIKPAMRASASPFAGEVSGHFYFRDFFTCDTGMLPWLLILELLGTRGQTLEQAVAERAAATPASDEINFTTPTPAKQFLSTLEPHVLALAPQHERVDGISIATETWRANIRASSNEPLLRLNVEARTSAALSTALHTLQTLVESHGAHTAGGH